MDRAWERIEASLGRVLPASLRQLKPPAEVQAIDAMESALAVALPQEFRASLRVHDGTKWPAPHRGQPSPVPLECLYDTSGIVTATRMWRGNHGQVVRVDVECSSWVVLAASWTELLVRYAEDLELHAASPDSSPLEIDQDCGPACEWGSIPTDSWTTRPAWLRDVRALNPYPWEA